MVRGRALVELLQEQIIPLQLEESSRAGEVDKLLKGGLQPEHIHKNREKQTLSELSHTSLLSLIVEYSAQQLVAQGVSGTDEDVQHMWTPFDRNGLPSRQGALWTAVLSYGEAYGLVLPGDKGAYMRAFSPKGFGALYSDPADDDFPMWAWRVIPQPNNTQHWRIYDDVAEHFLAYEHGQYVYVESREHGLGVCPVVRLTADADLEGNVIGEPLKFETDARRHDKTVNDRLNIQHYNSWRVKYATKMSDGWSEEERREFRMKLEHDDILIGTDDTEFGTLPETSMASMVAAQEADRDLLAAVSQTPVWAFNGGSMVNLSADALVEAKSGNRQKVWTIQREVNRPLVTWLRLAAQAEGRVEDSLRFDLAVDWADIGSQSMAAAADSLGKLATMLGVPVEMLWEMIPGVSQRTVQRWREWSADHPVGDLALAEVLTRQTVTSGADG